MQIALVQHSSLPDEGYGEGIAIRLLNIEEKASKKKLFAEKKIILTSLINEKDFVMISEDDIDKFFIGGVEF